MLCNEWANMASNSSGCRAGQVLYSWAVGRKEFYFPPHVGLEVGGMASDRVQYVLLEMHYDNRDERAGFVDSSGLRLYYTTELREHAAGVLMVGLSPEPVGQVLPNGLDAVTHLGFCTAQCTRDTLPDEGVTMFGSVLHGHTVARAIRLRQIRDGKELEPVNVNEAFDFDYQQLTLLSEERAVLPGDVLLAQCTYDTSAAQRMLYGGESSSEEMCLNYVYYYPRRADFAFCLSSHLETQWTQWFEEAQDEGFYDAEADSYDVTE